MSRASKALVLVVLLLLTVAAGTAMAADKKPQPAQPKAGDSEVAASGQGAVAPADVSGPLGGKTITFKDSKKDKDHFYNTFSVEASNCSVSPGASITFIDADGTEATIKNEGRSVAMSTTSTTVKGKGTFDRHHNIGFFFAVRGDGFIDRNSTVQSSEGITCA